MKKQGSYPASEQPAAHKHGREAAIMRSGKPFLRLLLLILCITLMTGFTACTKKKDTGKEDPPDPGTTDTGDTNPGTTDSGPSEQEGEDGTDAGNGTASFDLAAAEAAASEAADRLKGGEYQSVADTFDATVAASLNAEQLKQSWEELLSNLGGYVERVSVTSEEQQGYFIVKVMERYEKNGLSIQIAYNPDGQISGLTTAYQKLDEDTPETTDTYAEEVITVSGDPNLPLDGLLTLPAGVEKPPVVILIQGSGSSDKNETIGAAANKPFADLAHGLAEQGIASIRYDKRSYTYPEAFRTLESLTMEKEYLEDVSAAIALAQADSRLDTEHIFVLGHSLGGMMTPRIAYDHPELGGIISMAGSLRPLWEITYDQNVEAVETLRGTLTGNDLKTLEAQMEQVEQDIAVLRGDFSDRADSDILLGIPVAYWKSLRDNAGTDFIDKIDLPILALQGSADFQVSPEKDFQLWVDTISPRPHTSCLEYKDLNHLMMPTTGKRDISDYDAEAHVDTQVILDIAEFIKAQLP